MGQKVNPLGFRLGISKQWRSRWYANRDFPALLREDELLRKYLKARLGHAAISDITNLLGIARPYSGGERRSEFLAPCASRRRSQWRDRAGFPPASLFGLGRDTPAEPSGRRSGHSGT
mgnify:CR=1 FL=1